MDLFHKWIYWWKVKIHPPTHFHGWKARMSHSSIHLFIHLSICRLSGYLDEARTRLKGIDSRGTFGGDGAMNIAPAPLPDWLGWRPNLPSPSSSFSPKYFLLTFFKIHESYILKTKQDSHSDQFHVLFNKKENKFIVTDGILIIITNIMVLIPYERIVSLNLAMCWGQYIPGVILLWQEGHNRKHNGTLSRAITLNS